jgi:hypothetical protein
MSGADGSINLRLGKLKLKSAMEKEKKSSELKSLNEPSSSKQAEAEGASLNYRAAAATTAKKLAADVFVAPNAYTNFSLVNEIKIKRDELFASVLAFPFNHHRVRFLSDAEAVANNSKGILYWMSRNQRVQGKNKNLSIF